MLLPEKINFSTDIIVSPITWVSYYCWSNMIISFWKWKADLVFVIYIIIKNLYVSVKKNKNLYYTNACICTHLCIFYAYIYLTRHYNVFIMFYCLLYTYMCVMYIYAYIQITGISVYIYSNFYYMLFSWVYVYMSVYVGMYVYVHLWACSCCLRVSIAYIKYHYQKQFGEERVFFHLKAYKASSMEKGAGNQGRTLKARTDADVMR